MTAGPKTEYVRDRNGEPVVGLQIQREKDVQGRPYETYFAKTDKGKRKRFGSSRDKDKAIHRFRVWQATEGKRPKPKIPVVLPADDATFDALYPNAPNSAHLVPALEADMGNSPTHLSSDLEAIRRQERESLRALIYSNPKQAATELDCEPLALLADVDNLKPPAPSKPLPALCDAYLDDKTLSPKEAKNSRTWWDEFRAITKAKLVTDLDRAAFRKFRKTIHARQGKHSNVWVRSRFGKVKTIVKHALIEIELTDREKSILSDVALLKPPSKPTPKPVDIPRKDLKAILDRADKWEKALILLALNAAYTNIDCQRLRWDVVDLDNGTVRDERSKSEHLSEASPPRICALWKRTITALKAIKNRHTNVFVSRQGQPAHIDTINDHFVNHCLDLGLTKQKDGKTLSRYTFKHLRKSALTAASNSDNPVVPDRQIDLLAGHSAGIKEHYVVKKNVLLACRAIERYYFGNRA